MLDHSLAARRRRTLATAAFFALFLSACATTDGSHGAIDYEARGTGAPVVVYQSGLGDGLGVWQAVQARTAATTTAVSFSRPGYGRSAAVDAGERSPCAVAAETRTFLRASGFAPPYLLVGHSLGGLYQYAFAKLYPQEVAGVVLLDPTHPEHWPSVQRDVPALATMISVARAAFSAPMRREFDDQSRCTERLQALPMPSVPVRLLVRGRFAGLEAGAFENVARRLQTDWSKQLGGVAIEPVAGAGHYIQRDRPDAVAAAVAEVVATARKR
jgi:pimeloyl-ACP methyl ester carboxylesterase